MQKPKCPDNNRTGIPASSICPTVPGAAAPSDNVFLQILSSLLEKESGPLNPQMDVCGLSRRAGGPEYLPCWAAGNLWYCGRDEEASRKQSPVRYIFSLHVWCTVGPQALGQRGLMNGTCSVLVYSPISAPLATITLPAQQPQVPIRPLQTLLGN